MASIFRSSRVIFFLSFFVSCADFCGVVGAGEICTCGATVGSSLTVCCFMGSATGAGGVAALDTAFLVAGVVVVVVVGGFTTGAAGWLLAFATGVELGVSVSSQVVLLLPRLRLSLPL